jgi:hypothetical protein
VISAEDMKELESDQNKMIEEGVIEEIDEENEDDGDDPDEDLDF